MKDFNIQLELDLVKNSLSSIDNDLDNRNSRLIRLLDIALVQKANELKIGIDVLVLSCVMKDYNNQYLTDIAEELVREVPIGINEMREQINSWCKLRALETFAKEKLAYFESRIQYVKE